MALNDENDLDERGRAPDLDIRIDELILHGAPDLARTPFERALSHELGRLLAHERGLVAQASALEVRRPLHVPIASGATSQDIGFSLARAIHGALKGS